MMNLHKLTAGNGYTYLTRQVTANDAADTGYANLGELTWTPSSLSV